MKFTAFIKQRVDVDAQDEAQARRLLTDLHNAPFKQVVGMAYSLRTVRQGVEVLSLEERAK